MSDLRFPTYGAIGVRPLINCRGYYTIISGSLLLPEVRAAMTAASRSYVHLDELAEAVGRRISGLMQCEWGLVVNGCAAALAQVTAAAVAGGDPEKIARLPDTAGMKNEVIVQPSHRHVYDHAVRAVGVKMVEVRTREELERAVGARTALLLMMGDAADRGEISVAEMAACGKARGIPSFVDAAAERPDVPNRYLAEGVDAVAYSGGKCLRGPQSSGLVLGRKELLQAAFLNGAPPPLDRAADESGQGGGDGAAGSGRTVGGAGPRGGVAAMGAPPGDRGGGGRDRRYGGDEHPPARALQRRPDPRDHLGRRGRGHRPGRSRAGAVFGRSPHRAQRLCRGSNGGRACDGRGGG